MTPCARIHSLLWLTLALTTGVWKATAATRLVASVELSPAPSRVDITFAFECRLQYLNHFPTSDGTELQIKLRALSDCGTSQGLRETLPTPSGADSPLVEAALDWQSDNEPVLTLRFAQLESYVLTPQSDLRGLRVRLLRQSMNTTPGRKLPPAATPKTEPAASGDLAPSVGAPAGYVVNLASSRGSFDAAAVARARELGKGTVYVADADLGGKSWQRLRLGFYPSAVEAQQVLDEVKSLYPDAWIAKVDEQERLEALRATPVAQGMASQTAAPVREFKRPADLPPQSNEQLDRVLTTARTALDNKDHATAIRLFTRLSQYPEYPQHALALELLGLARERNGQLAHAKAEYDIYLQHYPDGEGAARVRQRLSALVTATVAPKQQLRAARKPQKSSWDIYGGVSQLYRRDSSSLTTDDISTDTVSQNAMFNDVDFTARRRGERFDITSRINAGYVYDLLPDGPGDVTRVSAAYVNWADRHLQLDARLGRQSRNTGGVLGTFDGLNLGYQLLPRVKLSTTVGFPVESSRYALNTARQFLSLSAGFGTFGGAWDFSVFGVQQQYEGVTDRQAIGGELRYFRPGRTLLGMVDYDISYSKLNNALLLGSLDLPGRWSINGTFDRRLSPVISTRNAIIGQPATDFTGLVQLVDESTLRQLAADRTPQSAMYTLGISKLIGERYQLSTDVTMAELGGTAASGGVEAIPGTGTEYMYNTQLIASSLFQTGDISIIGLRYVDRTTSTIESLHLNSRFSVGRGWRLGPRLRFDYRQLDIDGSDQWIASPSLRLDYNMSRRMRFEFEFGSEWSTRRLPLDEQKEQRYYIGAGYRATF